MSIKKVYVAQPVFPFYTTKVVKDYQCTVLNPTRKTVQDQFIINFTYKFNRYNPNHSILVLNSTPWDITKIKHYIGTSKRKYSLYKSLTDVTSRFNREYFYADTIYQFHLPQFLNLPYDSFADIFHTTKKNNPAKIMAILKGLQMAGLLDQALTSIYSFADIAFHKDAFTIILDEQEPVKPSYRPTITIDKYCWIDKKEESKSEEQEEKEQFHNPYISTPKTSVPDHSPKVDDSIFHTQFGAGSIAQIDGDIITVKFSHLTKRMSYSVCRNKGLLKLEAPCCRENGFDAACCDITGSDLPSNKAA